MYKFYYPTKDAWISESSGSSNFGYDQILEIGREYYIDNDFTGVSRALVQFNLTSISESVDGGTIPGTAKYHLKLYFHIIS